MQMNFSKPDRNRLGPSGSDRSLRLCGRKGSDEMAYVMWSHGERALTEIRMDGDHVVSIMVFRLSAEWRLTNPEATHPSILPPSYLNKH